MNDPRSSAASSASGSSGEPRRSRLGHILAEHPEERPRLWRAVSSLIGASVVALAAIGILLVLHLPHRAQLIRDRLSPPRRVSLPELSPTSKPDAGLAEQEPDATSR